MSCQSLLSVLSSSEPMYWSLGLTVSSVARQNSPVISLLGWELAVFPPGPSSARVLSWCLLDHSSKLMILFILLLPKGCMYIFVPLGLDFQHRSWKDPIHSKTVNYSLPVLLSIENGKTIIPNHGLASSRSLSVSESLFLIL